MKVFVTWSPKWSVLTVAVCLSLVAACGDADTYRIRTSPWDAAEPRTNWDGTLVELVRATTRCDAEDGEGLIVPVDSQIEFSGERVAALKSSCAGSVEVEVSIDVDGRSIIYDFSSVSKPGVFTGAGFNGYVFTEIAGVAPELAGARVDRELSTLALGDDALRVEGRVLRANFAGIPFDATDFFKIDLSFVESDEN